MKYFLIFIFSCMETHRRYAGNLKELFQLFIDIVMKTNLILLMTD
jgi:hypothetical protein